MSEPKEEKNKEKESYEDFVSQFIAALERALGVSAIPRFFLSRIAAGFVYEQAKEKNKESKDSILTAAMDVQSGSKNDSSNSPRLIIEIKEHGGDCRSWSSSVVCKDSDFSKNIDVK